MRYWLIPNPVGKGWLCITKTTALAIGRTTRLTTLIPSKYGYSVLEMKHFYRGEEKKKLLQKYMWSSPQSLLRALKKHMNINSFKYKWLNDTIIIKAHRWEDISIEIKPKGGVDLCNHVRLT